MKTASPSVGRECLTQVLVFFIIISLFIYLFIFNYLFFINSCPSLVIPGFTHDVTEYFLSEVYEFLSRTPLSKPATVKSKRFKPDCSSSQVFVQNVLIIILLFKL